MCHLSRGPDCGHPQVQREPHEQRDKQRDVLFTHTGINLFISVRTKFIQLNLTETSFIENA